MNLRFLVHIVITAFLAACCAEVCHAGGNQEFSANQEFNANQESNANQEFNRKHKFKSHAGGNQQFNANQESNANQEFNRKRKFNNFDELTNRGILKRLIFLKLRREGLLFRGNRIHGVDRDPPEPSLHAAPPPNEGNMYLLPSDQVEKPLPDLATLPCWANDEVHGIAFRTQWSRVEPSEHNYFWDVLDQCASLAEANGKTFSILVTAGVTTPQWVFDAGATKFEVSEENGSVGSMPVPWDKVFQNKWSSFVSALATRYGSNPNLVYVVMGGFGRRAESFFVTTEEDQAALGRAGTGGWLHRRSCRLAGGDKMGD